MINGRRADLDQLLGQARVLWQARTTGMASSRMSYVLSRLTLLALFASVVSTRSELPTLTLHEVPSIVFPFVIVIVVGAWLRWINVQVAFSDLPSVRLPFHAAPMLRRASLHVTALLSRARALAATPLPHIGFEGSEAVRIITLFAQRMSRSWLELRAALEALIQLATGAVHSAGAWIAYRMPTAACRFASLDRSPRVTVLRC